MILTNEHHIGSKTLATYTYTSDRNNYLQKLAYGNGDSVQYTYDDYGRVTKQTYEDGETVTYQYDNNGALATVTDSETGISTTYYYDFTDRLMKYVESADGYSHSVGYEYDEINNLTALVETINGVEHTTSYTYDEDNRVSSVTNGSATKNYTYDAYGRMGTQTTKTGSITIKTDTFGFTNPSATTTTGQVASHTIDAANYDKTFTYTYDDNGNILTISDGTNTTTYTYDSANQLVREDNQAAGKSHTWTYDDAGNITSHKEYAYTTGTLGSVTRTHVYGYGDSAWGDLLTAHNSYARSYDGIGNMLSDGFYTYTWKHGRQLATWSYGSNTWTYIYNADGMRTKRTNGSITYEYIYNGSQLTQMKRNGSTFLFTYDASGTPMTVTYNGVLYYYVTNIQGDVIAILNSAGEAVVEYTYDAWGYPTSISGEMVSILGNYNPLRYRGYVFDLETLLYYLQSRYYEPWSGRFINADAFVSTGQGLLGNNMFAYCNNNPIMYTDSTGNRPVWFESNLGGALAYSDTGTRMTANNSESIFEVILESVTDPRENGVTFSVGPAISSAWGDVGGGKSYALSVDNTYNYAVQESTSLSASSSVGYSGTVGLAFTVTNAKNVQDLAGYSRARGITIASGLGISIDVVDFVPASDPNTRNWGVCVTIAWGAGADYHASDVYTTSSESWNPWKNLKNRLFGR